MEYTKPPLTFEEQADLIISRGLKADRDRLIRRLKNVNYYRLSAYLYPFRITGSDNFHEKATLDLIWKYYTFDRQLRILVMDAIERVEVSVRTQLTYCFVRRFHLEVQHGAFCYTSAQNLPLLNKDGFDNWLKEMRGEVKRSRETFLDHFKEKYGDSHDLPPLWMLCEIMSFGKMLTFFNGIENKLRQTIARQYGLEDKILQSWLGSLNVIRNVCAHHGRLWNRELGFKPMIPRRNKYPQWHKPIAISNNRLFGILTILEYMRKRTASTSQWKERLKKLFAEYPEIPLKSMGFPENWEESPLWKP